MSSLLTAQDTVSPQGANGPAELLKANTELTLRILHLGDKSASTAQRPLARFQ